MGFDQCEAKPPLTGFTYKPRPNTGGQRDIVTGKRAKWITVECDECYAYFKRPRQDTWQHNCDECRTKKTLQCDP